MEIKQRIEVAKTNLRRAENQKIAAETNKAQAERQQGEVIEKMTAEGVTPETINEEIGKLEAQIEADLGNVERMIPTV